jgi:hypothetical protein
MIVRESPKAKGASSSPRMQILTDSRSCEQPSQLAAQVPLRGPAELAVRPQAIRRAPRPQVRVALARKAPPAVAAAASPV